KTSPKSKAQKTPSKEEHQTPPNRSHKRGEKREMKNDDDDEEPATSSSMTSHRPSKRSSEKDKSEGILRKRGRPAKKGDSSPVLSPARKYEEARSRVEKAEKAVEEKEKEVDEAREELRIARRELEITRRANEEWMNGEEEREERAFSEESGVHCVMADIDSDRNGDDDDDIQYIQTLTKKNGEDVGTSSTSALDGSAPSTSGSLVIIPGADDT
ncbi:hypothetical protein PMAYCL1PPCAC_02056, partial [Pristionchus mayeri]